MEDFRTVVGNRIRAVRQGVGLSQARFAEGVGMRRWETLSNYERGKSEAPLSVLVAISERYGVPLYSLIPADTYSTAPTGHGIVAEGTGDSVGGPPKLDPDAAACLDELARSGVLEDPSIREIVQLLIRVGGERGE